NTAAEFRKAQNLKSYIGKAGAVTERKYHPDDIFRNPPGPADITLELLMAAQVHMGHNTSLWNPANGRYIFGVREGIHIISLEQTAAHLRRAASIVDGVAYAGGNILFVGNRPGQTRMVVQAARMAKGYHLFTKWPAGAITNSDVLLRALPVEMVDEHDNPIASLSYHDMDAQPVKPDLVVCLNPLENYVLLHECALANIPTIGVIDTNAEPTWVTYPIPANDDSLRSVATIASILGRAGEEGNQRRLQAAAQGTVTWETPSAVATYMLRQADRAAALARQKAVQAQLLHEAVTRGGASSSSSAASSTAPAPSSSSPAAAEEQFVDPASEGSVRQQELMDKQAAAAAAAANIEVVDKATGEVREKDEIKPSEAK
ncbi:ribosomal protein S2, flavodoxin-like domain-containing protein, partial [Microdochium trichocladiopsis]